MALNPVQGTSSPVDVPDALFVIPVGKSFEIQVGGVTVFSVSGTSGETTINNFSAIGGILSESGNIAIGATAPDAGYKFQVRTTGAAAALRVLDSNGRVEVEDLRITGLATSLMLGRDSGVVNEGVSNTFVGSLAGAANTIGALNAFFGRAAGESNTTASNNSFFGYQAGRFNTTGTSNSFFGYQAGLANTTALSNSFFGRSAGIANTEGANNSFFGREAGYTNTTGSNNIAIGYQVALASATASNQLNIGGWITGLAGDIAIGSAALTAGNKFEVQTDGPTVAVAVNKTSGKTTLSLANIAPLASDPGTPVDGDIWVTTGGVLKFRANGVTYTAATV